MDRDLKEDMYRAVRDLIGKGYVSDYYEQLARPFIHIAELALERQNEKCSREMQNMEDTNYIVGLDG